MKVAVSIIDELADRLREKVRIHDVVHISSNDCPLITHHCCPHIIYVQCMSDAYFFEELYLLINLHISIYVFTGNDVSIAAVGP